MVGQSQVIVKAPVQYPFTVEAHPGTDFPFQFRKEEIVIRQVGILGKRAGFHLQLVEQINHRGLGLLEFAAKVAKKGIL